MFEKLIEALVGAWDRLSCAEIIHAYESAGVLRFGRYHRTIGPGWHWKWPIVEHVIDVNTCTTTQRLPPQTLTTMDGHGVVVAAIIRYQIVDIQPYITDIWDQQDVLVDVAMGAIRSAVGRMNWADLLRTPPEDQVVKQVRRSVNQYGFKIGAITFTDIGRVRSIRLIQSHPLNLAN